MCPDPTNERNPPDWLTGNLPGTTPAEVIDPEKLRIVCQPLDLNSEEKSWQRLRSFISGETDLTRRNILTWIKANSNEILGNQLREVVSDLPYFDSSRQRRSIEILVYVSLLDTNLANQIRGNISDAYREEINPDKKEMAKSVKTIIDTCREANISARSINRYGLVASLFNRLSGSTTLLEQIDSLDDLRWKEDLNKELIQTIEVLSRLTADIDQILKNSIDQYCSGKISKHNFISIFKIFDKGSFDEENDNLHQYCFDKIRKCFSTPTPKSIEQAIRLSYVVGLLDYKSTRENIGINSFQKFLVSACDFTEKGNVTLQDGFKMLFAYSGGADSTGDEVFALLQSRMNAPGHELNLDILDLIRTSHEYGVPSVCWFMFPRLLIDGLENQYIQSSENWAEAKKEFRRLCRELSEPQSVYLAAFLGEVNSLFLPKLIDAIPWGKQRANILAGIVELLDSSYENGRIPSAEFMNSIGLLLDECRARGETYYSTKMHTLAHKYLNILTTDAKNWTRFESETFAVCFTLNYLSQNQICLDFSKSKESSDKTLMLAFKAINSAPDADGKFYITIKDPFNYP